MNYKINTSVYGSMFAIPAAVTDNYIKLSSASQLKTLLWVFRNADKPINPDVISSEIGYSAADVTDALTVLTGWGMLSTDDAVQETVPTVSEPVRKTAKTVSPAVKPDKKFAPVVNPTYEDIIKRCNESPEIKNLFAEIESLLCKSLGYNSECILLNLYDHYGLSLEVIYMLVDYCLSEGKANFSYIQKVGADWGEREINTIEKADEQINILKSCSSVWNAFAKMAGIQNSKPTTAQSAFLRTWTTEMKFNLDMIYSAYEEMMNHCSRISFPYMNKILSSWYESGIKTLTDIENSRKPTPSGKKNAETGESSYDINEVVERAAELPVYKKGD